MKGHRQGGKFHPHNNKKGIDQSIFDSEGKKIPNAPYYVTLTDKFMSNWGMAEGKKNKLVIPTKDLEEAELVKQEAEKRSEWNGFEIKNITPHYNHEKYYVQVKTREDMPKVFALADKFHK